MRRLILFFLCFSTTASLLAQNGDKAGEEQPLPPGAELAPPAPPLTPAEALKTFHLPPGFRIEVVASDPMIAAPVQIAFDGDGRMFVLEMRGYMPNADGKGENQPVGRVSLLEDTDGDGVMDKSTLFADGLVMPRAMCIVREGLLVAEPPHLWLFRDTNHDGKADSKVEISNVYGDQVSPEHTANGLMRAMDNWIYSADHTLKYREINGEWKREPTTFRGQWGITEDDFGRFFFNSNSDQLRGDLVPDSYLSRNLYFRNPFGVNVQIAKDQATWPIRVNPGVNRGYQKGQLRPDGRLATYTAACAPCIYRGDIFPSRYYGAAFVCEPSANFVRCNLLTERDGMITAVNAFDKAEFLASTDERFRPVNLFNGPDGALYVVDMYHGILQHRIFLTTYLRKQSLSRGLEAPVNQGRIYRIVPADFKRAPLARLEEFDTAGLVLQMHSKNGWNRDTAQRLLVERQDLHAIEPLKKIAQDGADALAQLQALWTLEGLGGIDRPTLLAALSSAHSKVRVAGIRLSEPYLRNERPSDVQSRVLALAGDPSADVRIQLTLSLGESRKPEAMDTLVRIVEQNVALPLVRDGAVTGLGGREFPFIERLLGSGDWNEKSAAREQIIRNLAQCVLSEGNKGSINQLLDLTATNSGWQQEALLEGMISLLPAKNKSKTTIRIKPVMLASEPKAFATLKSIKEPAVAEKVAALDTLVMWPGKPGAPVLVEAKPLTAKEKESFDSGKVIYTTICAACHQPHGLGLEGLAPPLVDSDWVLGSPKRLTRIVLHGIRGPLTVKGRNWALEMPPLNILEDNQIADVLTYVRHEWGHTASPVTQESVAAIREATKTREEAWNEADLLKVQ